MGPGRFSQRKSYLRLSYDDPDPPLADSAIPRSTASIPAYRTPRSRIAASYDIFVEDVLMEFLGRWIIAECGAHAKGGELLREAAARTGPRAAGQGPPGTLPEEILWQERLCDAYVYSGWVPHVHLQV